MKKTEIILLIVLLLTIVLHLFHAPWSGILLAIAMLSLSMFYYIFGFTMLNNKILKNSIHKTTYRILFAVGIGWTFSVVFIGALFKLEHLPYANYITLVGLISSCLIIGFALFLTLKVKSIYFIQILLRAVIIASGGLIIFLVN